MTTFAGINLSWLGVTSTEDDKLLIRHNCRAVTNFNGVAFISEDSACEWWLDDDSDLLGAIIPASLAKELIAEGRLNPPPMTSTTVVKGYNA